MAGGSPRGMAFGRGPARGTLPRQMAVEGFEGRGLVNSFAGGDGLTGVLTSPPFAIDRGWIRFLVGGGGWPGETCINLIVYGKIVRTAAGPNTEAGGSERLEAAAWGRCGRRTRRQDLADPDRRPRHPGLGPHQRQPDRPHRPQAARALRDVTRELTLEHRYLHLPVKTAAPKRRMAVLVDGQTVREFEIEWRMTPAGGHTSTSTPGQAGRPCSASTGWPKIDRIESRRPGR